MPDETPAPTSTSTPPPAQEETVESLKKALDAAHKTNSKIGRENQSLRRRLREAEKGAGASPASPGDRPSTGVLTRENEPPQVDDDDDHDDDDPETASEALAVLLSEMGVRQPRFVHEKLRRLATFDAEDRLLVDGVPAQAALDVLIPHSLLPPKGGGGSGSGAPLPPKRIVPPAPKAPDALRTQAAYEAARRTESAVDLQTRIQKGGPA